MAEFNGEEWLVSHGGLNFGSVDDVANYTIAKFTVGGGTFDQLQQQVNQVQSTANSAYSLLTSQQGPNLVYAGPASGASATPGYRALVLADLPAPYNSNGPSLGNVTAQSLLLSSGTGNTQFTMDTAGGMSVQFFANDTNGYGFYNFVSAQSPLTFNKTTDKATFLTRPLFGAATPWDSGNLSIPLTLANGGTGGTTQATARAGIGAAASGANGDITSLTGLTTALGIAEGGTGQTTQGAAFTALLGASTVPVANGGTGATTAAAARTALGAAALAGLSTQQFSVADATSANQATAYDQVFGVGQTLTNVTASRALGTTYTNATGKPIFVGVNCSTSGGTNASLSVAIGGFTMETSVVPTGFGIGISFVVPAGATYNVAGGNTTLTSWTELR